MASAAGARHRVARPVITHVHQIPTVQDLWDQDALEEDTSPIPGLQYDKDANRRVSVWRGDITTIAADVIVNAANRSLLGGGGVDGAIHRAAGPELYDECKTLGGAETGETKMTLAYNLPSRYIAHTVGPIYSSAHEMECRALLRRCYHGSLVETAQAGARTVAFSSISTGIYGYPFLQAAHIAIVEARKWVQRHREIDRIIFVVFSERDEAQYLAIIPRYFPGPPDNDPEFAELEQAARVAEGAQEGAFARDRTADGAQEGEENATQNATSSDTIEPQDTANTVPVRFAAEEEAVNTTPAGPSDEDGVSGQSVNDTAERSVPSLDIDPSATQAEAKATPPPVTVTNTAASASPSSASPGKLEYTSSKEAGDAIIQTTAAADKTVATEESEPSVKDEAASDAGGVISVPEAATTAPTPDVPVPGKIARADTGEDAEEDADWIKVERDTGGEPSAGLATPIKSESDIDWPTSSQTLVEEEGDIKKDMMPFITMKVDDTETETPEESKEADAERESQKGQGDESEAGREK